MYDQRQLGDGRWIKAIVRVQVDIRVIHDDRQRSFGNQLIEESGRGMSKLKPYVPDNIQCRFTVKRGIC